MPLVWFTCPDRVNVGTEECLDQCRLAHRCLTRTTLQVLRDTERVWDGVPHVTSLLNGTMMEYLKITTDYALDPRECAFALLGSTHHKLLGLADTQTRITERHLSNGWMQGTLDLLELEGGGWTLTDCKTWGSHRVVRALGVVKGPRGFVANMDHAELDNEELQLNAYRYLAEQSGQSELVLLPIVRLQLQVTVRDGGIAVAKSRGITEKMYLIPVRMLDDQQVLQRFGAKALQLRLALDGRSEPAPCTPEEHWGYNRCKEYCPVAAKCPIGKEWIHG